MTIKHFAGASLSAVLIQFGRLTKPILYAGTASLSCHAGNCLRRIRLPLGPLVPCEAWSDPPNNAFFPLHRHAWERPYDMSPLAVDDRTCASPSTHYHQPRQAQVERQSQVQSAGKDQHA